MAQPSSGRSSRSANPRKPNSCAEEGDKVSAQGSFKVEPYTARDGQTRINRTIFADHILALRQPPRERKPKAAPADATPAPARADFDDGFPEQWGLGR